MAARQVALWAFAVSVAFAPLAMAEDAAAPATDAQLAAPATGDGAATRSLVSMGTGSITGVYFPVGVALCRLVNQHRPETGIRCAARQTAGSVENLTGLRDASLEFAIVQSDALEQAVAGSGAFAAAGPDTAVRSVINLYPEALTLVARDDAGVARVEDLPGKRVALGAQGSGTRTLVQGLISALGWTDTAFAATPDVDPAGLAQALCDGQIDAFFYAVGHPARAIQEAATNCDARLVPIEGAAVDEMVKAEPAYVETTIPGGIYRGNAGPVATFGVSAVLATGASVPDATVTVLVKSVVDDLDMLKGLEPVLSGLDPKVMVTEGMAAPMHPAALAVYREKG